MEQKLDLWSGCAVFVSAIAIVVWAGATTLMIGDTWVPWAAAGVVILAIGSAVVRAWVKAKDVVWTEELRAGQRRRAYRMLRELLPIFLLSLGLIVLNRVSSAGVLPPWVVTILVIGLLVGWFWLRRVVRRGGA